MNGRQFFGFFARMEAKIGSQFFQIGYTGDAATNAFSAAGGNDVVLKLIPEPGTASLLILGAMSLGLRRRRRG